MYEIKEFCQKIDRNKPDIFQECIKSGHIDPEREEIEDLQKEELIHYNAQVKAYYENYAKSW